MAITHLDDEGRGVGEAGGREIHVAGVLPGERARVRIEHESPHRPLAWGALVALEGPPAGERVPPACPAHPRCGGCLVQHLAYPAQLAAKRARVAAALPGVAVEETVASPRTTEYRNKAKYVLGAGGAYGSFAPGTHELVDMRGCRVPERPLDELAARLAALAAEAGVPVYDERTRTGELRYLILRRAHDGRVLAVIVARSAASRAALAEVARALAAAEPALAGVVLSVNPTTGGALFAEGGADEVLHGVGRLADRVGDVTLELSARSFFQVNRAQAARLYADAAAAALAAGPRVVDLYAGVGGLALTVARAGGRAVGVESLPAAVEDARRSATAQGLDARFLIGDAAAGLPEAAALLGGVDALIVDPPRKGLSAAARAAIRALAPPRLVYLSCEPGSLGRDVAALGGRVVLARPYDLMPGTMQVETLVVLER